MSSEDEEKRRYTAEDTREWVERLTRRHLGDARIHRSQASGQLARRLGARAFTTGRDVYVQPELGDPETPEGAALLAHELYHVAEQSGATLPSASDMPLLAPPSTTQANTALTPASAASVGRGGVSVQRSPGSAASSSSEQSAESAEAAMRSSKGPGKKPSGPKPPDAEELANKVYSLILRELVTDRERNA